MPLLALHGRIGCHGEILVPVGAAISRVVRDGHRSHRGLNELLGIGHLGALPLEVSLSVLLLLVGVLLMLLLDWVVRLVLVLLRVLRMQWLRIRLRRGLVGVLLSLVLVLMVLLLLRLVVLRLGVEADRRGQRLLPVLRLTSVRGRGVVALSDRSSM